MINRRKTPRREHSRAKVNWPVTVIAKDSTAVGRVEDLSRGGALLYLKEQVELQQVIRIAIEVPEYNDVISAEAEVVRIYPLEQEIEHYTYAVGIKFTELSPQDLKFFTGNLAPEWNKNYRDPGQPPRSGSSLARNLGYALLGVGVFSLLFLAARSYNSDKVDTGQLTALEMRLKNIEIQLKMLPEVTAANRHLLEQLGGIQKELSSFRGDIVTAATVEQLQEKVNDNQKKIAEVTSPVIDESMLQQLEPASRQPAEKPVPESPQTASLEPLEAAAPEPVDTTPDKVETAPSSPAYHTVEKGETLYRIGVNYGIGVEGLRKLNNLAAGDVIRPGQKLLVR